MARNTPYYDDQSKAVVAVAVAVVLPHHQAVALAVLNLKINILLIGLLVHVLQKITKKENESRK